MEVRFTTYNIQFGIGQDGHYDLGRTVDAVGDADIVCLQEVTTHWERCGGDHQPDLLSSALNMYSVFAGGFELGSKQRDPAGRVDNRRRAFGNMILSRWPVVYSRCHSLGRSPTDIPPDFSNPRMDLPRCVLEGVVDVPGFPVRVMSVHLSHLPGGQRLEQIDGLRALLTLLPAEAPLWEKPDPMIQPWTQGAHAPPMVVQTIFAGDFNFEPTDPEYRAMLRPEGDAHLMDGWRLANTGDRAHAATCVDVDGSTLTLDYVFLTSGMADAVVGTRVREDITASDHFPLVFDLDL